jgi:hypothetical protein
MCALPFSLLDGSVDCRVCSTSLKSEMALQRCTAFSDVGHFLPYWPTVTEDAKSESALLLFSPFSLL